MGRIELLEPFLQGGLRNTNFFNGRLLSAEDLRTEQEAARAQAARLGRAVGAGVVWGLEVREAVTPSSPAGLTRAVVTVSKGLGINSSGQLLSLPADTEVALVRERDSAEPEAGLFKTCEPPRTTTVAVGTGVYVLVLTPASGFAGKAAASGLGGSGLTSPGCGSRYAVEGVQFKLLRLDLGAAGDGADAQAAASVSQLMTQTSVGARSRLRNLLAHLCLGTPRWLAFGRDLYSELTEARPASTFGALEALRESGELTDCDIPLALLHWGTDGIGFVDRWAVRRGVEASLTEDIYPAVASSRRAHARASLAQFVEHVQDLFAENSQGALAGLNLASLFAYLPPAGLVPVAAGGSPSGFNQTSFFGARASGTPTTVSADDMFATLRLAETHLPVEVAKTDILQLYWIGENLSAVQGGGGSSQLYLLYTSRALHGGRERDKVAQTLKQTWKSYSGVLKKSVLLPKTLNTASMPVWMSLQSAQQNVVNLAMAQEAAAASRALDRAGAMNAFSDLYDLQKELAQLLSSTFEGDSSIFWKMSFAAQLTQRLDVRLPDGGLGLKPALAADSIHAVVAAQKSINTLVSSWSGEVAFGHVLLQHSGSPRGTTLRPGDPLPYVYEVTVKNNTDKRVTIELAASVVQSTTGTWGDAVTIRQQGQQIDTVTLNATQQTVVNVEVRAPNDAADDGQLVRVRVDAAIPEPTGNTWSLNIDLHTGPEETEPVNFELRPFVVTRPTGRSNAATNTNFPFLFRTTYTASRPPTSINFVFRVTASLSGGTFGTAATNWKLFFQGRQEVLAVGTGGTTGTLQATVPITTADLEGVPITVTVTTPSARAATAHICTFSVEARATIIDSQSGDTVEISTVMTEQFTVTLNPS